jgi:A/G-specific adenine glycosylase
MGAKVPARQSSAANSLIARLLAWYDAERRVLPWRASPRERPDPYRVILSEVMLQQTTVAAVTRRYPAFVARFPTLRALAEADEEQVLHAWQGLGYYRRARALHACARMVMREHRGRLPDDERALRRLPGVGPYTAAAVRAIAFEQPAVPVDGNVLRVMARLHGIEAPLPGAARLLTGLAGDLAIGERPGDVAQALMDLGATVCRPIAPRCERCPWRADCRAHRIGIAEQLPRRAARAMRPRRRGLAFLLSRPDGGILFRKRAADGLLGGMHELPSSPWAAGPLDVAAALCHAPVAADWRLRPASVRHTFSHFVLELGLAEAATEMPPLGLWCRSDRLRELALPTVMKKLLRLAGHEIGGN